ncbi:RagB/SusD family nutrient uptake outer membrane protein [Chitinophaga solisilvae]|uniref:RagB/SusD family nutrient uptake outer membrane protein n=1 Tax=Chitinophaga solisilvae TaxID=1233460 RepID=UPI0013704084|nr:RagB/SusD family nutrient uptake outer membrane protein [Chitinophaga solisilvae]
MKKIFVYTLGLAAVFSACQKGPINSLNTPIVSEVIVNPTKSDLFNLATGAESGMRTSLGTYLDAISIIGRETYRFSGSEPRWTTDIMGGGTKALDNNTFYLTNPWANRYQVMRQCFILLESLKTTRDEIATDKQRKAFSGYAKTLIGYQLLLNFTMTYTNGIRVPVAIGEAQGPIITDPAAALAAISKFLDDGKADLTGSEVIFPLSDGFQGFKSAAGLIKFNRAIAARVYAYRQQWAEVLTALNESFFDLNGKFNDGIYHTYSTSGGDQTNPLYLQLNSTGEVRVAQPRFAAEITPGDDRINKTALRNQPASSGGLTGNRDLTLWPSLNAPITIIRNEELVLLYAEAKVQLNLLPDAIVALNRIRLGHNVSVIPTTPTPTQASLITEMLTQRRYSLFAEGHRWVDLRRYNLLSTLPKDRPDDDVWTMFPLPQSETAK